VLLLALLLPVSLTAGSEAEIRVLIPNDAGEEIAVEATENVFYLPSSADPTQIRFTCDAEISYAGNTLRADDTVDLTACKVSDERGADCYKLALTVNGKSTEYTFYHDDTLSSVFVSTSKGLSAIDADKEDRDKEAQIIILNKDGSAEYSDPANGTESEIKSRGNATWSYLKKPYQIKLATKTDLFGMGKAKTWILLANYTDQSALHNALGFHLGDALNIPYNIDYRFVDLYVDGEYRGLYMLTEKVQIGENRVDITDLEGETEDENPDIDLEDCESRTVDSGALIENTMLESYTYCVGIKSPSDITGGYLVELDGYGLSEPSHFVTDNGNIYTVKSPEYASREEVEYIAGLFADMEEAIYSETGFNRKGIHYTEYIDMQSFAGVYTVQELMKNWDAYIGSMFFFKDADENGERAKIYMGPLWDLDNTLGNINFNYEFGQDVAYLWAQNGVFQNYVRTFAKALMKQPDFRYEVAQQYAVAYSTVQSVLAENGWFAESVEEIRAGVMMDRTRWKLYDSDSWLLNRLGYKSSVKFVQFADYGTPSDTTKDTALGFMRYYLSARAEALLSSIGTAEVPPPITPPEESSTSSSSASQTSNSNTESSALNKQEQTGEVDPPDDEPTSTVVRPLIIIPLALVGTAVIVAFVLLIVKKKDCPCKKKQSQ
jgi:hypothetical protein